MGQQVMVTMEQTNPDNLQKCCSMGLIPGVLPDFSMCSYEGWNLIVVPLLINGVASGRWAKEEEVL